MKNQIFDMSITQTVLLKYSKHVSPAFSFKFLQVRQTPADNAAIQSNLNSALWPRSKPPRPEQNKCVTEEDAGQSAQSHVGFPLFLRSPLLSLFTQSKSAALPSHHPITLLAAKIKCPLSAAIRPSSARRPPPTSTPFATSTCILAVSIP